jgi:tetratricopeptide (TPR) repeat protein
MITEQHYEEEVLIALLEEGDATLDRDPHIAACAVCSATLASVRDMAGCLKSPAVWDQTAISAAPSEKVLATLRGAQSDMLAEDAVAEIYLRELLAGPRETWAARLEAHPEWRTAGTVRKLIAATDRAIETMPPDAVEITALAVDIAEGLGNARLRAHSWRERAYALYFTGAYSEALAAVAKAEAALEHVEASAVEFDRARLAVVEALLEAEREEYSEAIADANRAATTFRRYAQAEKYAAAKWTEAAIYQHVHRYADALRVYKTLISDQTVGERSRAALWQNIGACYTELGDPAQARQYYGKALIEFDRLQMITGRAKAKWSLAKTLMTESRYSEAAIQLVASRDEFEELGMVNDVVMTSLDMAETYVALDRPTDASSICSGLMTYFHEAGISQTSGALAAVSYLREAIAAGRATSSTISYVRDYFADLPSRPAMLFLPPC